MKDKSLVTVGYTSINGAATAARGRIVRETALAITVNQSPFATAMIMPTMVEEFVIGHLYGQQVISGLADIASITITGNRAEVTIAAGVSKKERPPVIESDFQVGREEIFSGVRAILKSAVFAETEAVHSAGLFRQDGQAICIAEDLGRHHALDKVIGYGLMHDVDFRRTFAASTGRQPGEMIIKCLNAGLPIIATKGVPTTLAIAMAARAGITIAGLVRGSAMTVYSNPARIL